MGRTRSGRAAARPTDTGGATLAVLVAATEHHREGRLREAEQGYRRVLHADPRQPVAHNLLGLILADRGEHAEALAHFDDALRNARADDPNLANIHNNRALSLLSLDRLDDVVESAKHALAIDPGHVPARHNLVLALLRLERFDEALVHARKLVDADRRRPESHGLLADALLHAGLLNDAFAAARHAIALGGLTAETSAALGATLRLLGELGEAETHLRAALSARPGWAAVRSTLATVLGQTGRVDEAAPLAAEACSLAPGDRDIAVDHAHLVLMSGDIGAGWDAYDAARGIEVTPSMACRRVLVKREQGIGDEILFATCYPDLIAEAGEVHLEADPRLVSLFARSFPEATVAPPQGISAVTADAVTWAGSLPGRYRRRLDAFPKRPQVLVADPERVTFWSERLAALGPGAKVGISWRSKVRAAQRRLEYTRLDEWDAIFAVPGLQLVNLQYDDCEEELTRAEQRFGLTIHRWDDLDLMDDFEGVAALIANLDAVVAPRNAVALLTGALGTDCVMLGNRYDWFDLGVDLERDGHPWMPSIHPVLRLCSEPWAPTLERAAATLARLVAP